MEMAISIIMTRMTYLITFALILLTAGNACAGTQSNIVSINTRVVPSLSYQVVYAESTLTITAADIAKGYVDISRGMELTVKTNSLKGYLVWFSLDGTVLKESGVYDDNNAYGLMRSGGEIHMPYTENNYIPKELSFRFYFSPEVKPGVYEWPLSVMVTAM